MLAWARDVLGESFDDFKTQLAQGGGGKVDGELLLGIESKSDLRDELGLDATISFKLWSRIEAVKGSKPQMEPLSQRAAPTQNNPQYKRENTDQEHVNIVVKDQSDTEVLFRIRKTAACSKMFKSYCVKKGVAITEFKFYFDGARLLDTDTPGEKEMEDGDTVDAVVGVIGGRITP